MSIFWTYTDIPIAIQEEPVLYHRVFFIQFSVPWDVEVLEGFDKLDTGWARRAYGPLSIVDIVALEVRLTCSFARYLVYNVLLDLLWNATVSLFRQLESPGSSLDPSSELHPYLLSAIHGTGSFL